MSECRPPAVPEDVIVVKRLALVLLLVTGCTKVALPPTPGSSVAPSVSAGATPLSLTTYDAGDFTIGVPAGWTQVAKDQPLSKSTNRCSFKLSGASGTTAATLVVTAAASPGAKLADQVSLLKEATLQQGETITAESRTEAGEPFGLRSTATTPDGPVVNYRFVAVSPQTLYLIGLSCRQDGPLSDQQALQIVESFTQR
jgi:hypothetical protein